MDRERLAPALRQLKVDGANILLVDQDREHGTGRSAAVACERLLGADDTDRRRLYLAVEGHGGHSPHPAIRAKERLDRAPDSDRVAVVDIQQASEEEPATAGDRPEWYTAVGPDASLAQVACLVNSHLRRLTADDPPAGSVRLCVSSLDELLDVHGPLKSARFLHVLTRRVKVAGAMAHYHVADRDDVAVPAVTRLFDAIVETRERPGGPQQRWSLPAADVETAWLPLRR